MTSIDFVYEYPMVFIDFVDIITGESVLEKLHKQEFPGKIHVLINHEDNELNSMKMRIDERFLPLIFMMFEKLGQLDQSVTGEFKFRE